MVIHIVIAVLVVVLLALLYAAYKVHFVLPYLAIRPSRMKHWIHGYFVPRTHWAP